MKLAITLASRGRPQQLVETVRRSIVNWTHPNTQMWIQLDDDDAASIGACEAAGFPKSVHLNAQPREDTIAEKWNRILSVPADVYSVAADDDPYVTPGYDASILKAAEIFPDGIGMVYGHLANLSFTCSLSATARWCEMLGFLQPALFPYWFVDHWTDDLARITGRIAFSDHRTDQSRAGKTQEMREPGWWATFYDAAYLMRRKQAHKIITSPDFHCLPWQRRQLLTGHPLIEARSRGINEGVRQQSQQLEGWSGLNNQDERYQRVRARAVELIPRLLADVDMHPNEAAMFRSALLPPATVAGLKRAYA